MRRLGKEQIVNSLKRHLRSFPARCIIGILIFLAVTFTVTWVAKSTWHTYPDSDRIQRENVLRRAISASNQTQNVIRQALHSGKVQDSRLAPILSPEIQSQSKLRDDLQHLLDTDIAANIEKEAVFFHCAWSFSGILVSLVITGFTFLYIIYKSFTGATPELAKLFWPTVFMLAGFCVALFGGIDALYNREHVAAYWPWRFEGVAIILAFFVLYYDSRLHKTGYFCLSSHWEAVRSFDIAIALAIVFTVALAGVVEHIHGNGLGAGFAAGATAFQLFLANIVFDPKHYEFTDEVKKRFTRLGQTVEAEPTPDTVAHD